MKISDYLYPHRLRPSTVARNDRLEEFLSDHSRIIFCSSFRKMMQKAQVFSLETNSSVRNRLTHSLEVADIGRTIARKVGDALQKQKKATLEDIYCLEAIIENACLIHDIGNPPFGHFGEEAIKRWYTNTIPDFKKLQDMPSCVSEKLESFDLKHFDGNPQGFRIVAKLHADLDNYGLNLTASTLLATLKYPCSSEEQKNAHNYKKIGIFSSERDKYEDICKQVAHPIGQRYFLVYLMELADDICYCLSDIADAFEKRVIDSRFFKEEFRKIADESKLSPDLYTKILPSTPISNFSHEVSIKVSRLCIDAAVNYFTSNIDAYIEGKEDELIKRIPEGKILECLKIFSRRHIYTEREIQRIEIAGHKIVLGLLEHYGALLKISPEHFQYFCEKGEIPRGEKLDIEWRIFNQLSKRMLKSYKNNLNEDSEPEWFCRCRLIVDYISGMTDQMALDVYQNIMGISL